MKPAAAAALEALRAHRDAMGNPHLRDLFAADPERFERFSLTLGDLTLDYSKNRIVAETMPLLFALAERAEVEKLRDAMFAGEPINETEGRAVLHVALRAPRRRRHPRRRQERHAGGARDARPLPRLRRPGALRRAPRRRRRQVRRRRQYRHRRLRSRAGDGDGRAHALSRRRAERALRLQRRRRASCRHARRARRGAHALPHRLEDLHHVGDDDQRRLGARMARLPARRGGGRRRISPRSPPTSQKVAEFGIRPERVFGFWDWVGGRYSVWSAIGLPLAISIGGENFRRFLAGAQPDGRAFPHRAARRRTCRRSWGCSASGTATSGTSARTRCSPYDQRLSRFAAHLQQLDMESNGKRVTRAVEARREPHRPDRLGRARHQRPARLLPAPAPGDGDRAGRLPDRRRAARGAWATTTPSSSPTASRRARRSPSARRKRRSRAELDASGALRRGAGEARAAQGVPRQPPVEHADLPKARPGDARHARSRSTSTRCSSRARSGTSTPSTSGAWSSARRSRRGCCRWWRTRSAREALDVSTQRAPRRATTR